MGTESFDHIKPALSVGEHVALIDQAYGDPVVAKKRTNAPGDNIQPAGLYSTAPYVEPPSLSVLVERKPAAPLATRVARKNRCTRETCGAPAMKSTGYCYGHSLSLGLIEPKRRAAPSTSRD
jgi:hypothetical protein